MENEGNEIPKYVVLEKSLVGNTVYEAGATVEYDGLPAENLEPTCDVGRARYQEYLASNADRVAKLNKQYAESAVGDPDKFAAALATAVAQAIAGLQPAAALNAEGQAVAVKPAAKGKADKPVAEGEGLV